MRKEKRPRSSQAGGLHRPEGPAALGHAPSRCRETGAGARQAEGPGRLPRDSWALISEEGALSLVRSGCMYDRQHRSETVLVGGRPGADSGATPEDAAPGKRSAATSPDQMEQVQAAGFLVLLSVLALTSHPCRFHTPALCGPSG